MWEVSSRVQVSHRPPGHALAFGSLTPAIMTARLTNVVSEAGQRTGGTGHVRHGPWCGDSPRVKEIRAEIHWKHRCFWRNSPRGYMLHGGRRRAFR